MPKPPDLTDDALHIRRFPRLPPELLSHIAALAGPETCAATRDLHALRQHLRLRAGCLSRAQQQDATDACVRHAWSHGIVLLADHGVLDLAQQWPFRSSNNNNSATSASPVVGALKPSMDMTSTLAYKTSNTDPAFHTGKRAQAAALTLPPHTIKKLWHAAMLYPRETPFGPPHSATLDILATLVLHADVGDWHELAAWCCQQCPEFATRLGRLLIEQGKGVDDVRAMCERVGVCTDDAVLADRFIDAAASCGRVDLLHWFDKCCPHLTEERTLLVCQAAASGSLAALHFLLERRYDKDLDDAFLVAVVFGKLKVAAELAKEAKFALSWRHVVKAAEHNQLALLRWMHDTGKLRRVAKLPQVMVKAIQANALDVVQWLSQQHGLRPDAKMLETAVTYGSLQVAQWLHQQGAQMPSSAAAWAHSKISQHLDLAKWVYFVAPEHFSDDNVVSSLLGDAIRTSSSAVAHWLLQHFGAAYQPLPDDLQALIRDGQLDLLRILHRRAPLSFAAMHLQQAVECGDLDLLCWIDSKMTGAAYTSAMVDTAAEKGYLPIVQWILPRLPVNDRVPRCAMDLAAAQRHQHVVKWLHKHVSGIPCSTSAMDAAAGVGHLELVQFLHTHRTEGCTAQAINNAAANGHREVVAWLHANRKEGCTVRAMNDASSAGLLHMVQWLHETRSEGCTDIAMDQAAANGWLDVVKYLDTHRTEGCTAWTMDNVAAEGNLTILKFLHEHRTEGCTGAALGAAARRGHFATVRFLCQHRTESVPATALIHSSDFPHIIDWLQRQQDKRTITTVPSNRPWWRRRRFLW
ncbi:hypothetical protein RI367_005267 [Sorochytrium milnesiophthora]